MKLIFKFLFVMTVITFLSCTKEEQVIDTVPLSWKILSASDTEPYVLSLYEQYSGTILVNDVYSLNNGANLDGKVEKIAEFGMHLFLFIPTKNKIVVINSADFKKQAVVDYSASGKTPTGICFPNATDAYITFANDSTVELLDMTNFKIARTISVGKKPVSIASSGNQIYVVNKDDNTVSVIDSRTHKVEATLQVPVNPFFVDFSADGAFAVIISIGAGKTDTLKKTAAMVTVINVNTRTIVKSQNLGTSSADAVNQIPLGLTVTEKSWAFVPTKTNLFKVNSRTGDFSSVSKNEYVSAQYNYKRDELIIIRKKGALNEIYTADPISAAVRNTMSFQSQMQVLLPMSY